ncbi:bacterial alpha-L-rhamnosidase-domain-containing protein [Ilyonectria robusta]|uniref:bacterial alpha-L-rhamnosidase-domain-containing protein n=1 Tax=Ilyonectria robusta TaxID=1079257 RepID=UPI001E8E327D|nr:bacterial alpha-L-rhamnosidase-domain-containing protein [Ilyonectria robusta]KAH8669858.1 bacterial alpha-L-rhamnosidase-domain-containing protein [Ilyonectria robusta]
MSGPSVVDVRFEHYRPGNTLGVHETNPRVSWRFANVPPNFKQVEYEMELSEVKGLEYFKLSSTQVSSEESHLVPWTGTEPLASRKRYSVRVRARGDGEAEFLTWSEPAFLELGLLSRQDWTSKLISAPWSDVDTDKPQPEDLIRKEFTAGDNILSARLYVTAQGVYEAEINGKRVGDYFLAPGWTSYAGQLHYQTYDVADLLSSKTNCIGFRLAEGWHRGRLSFGGGLRNIWGSRTTVLAQLEIKYRDGTSHTIGTDNTWTAMQGPIRLAELYDGETYDATAEVDGWSSAGARSEDWKNVDELPSLPESQDLIAGFKEPARRLDVVQPIEKITTPSGKIILDFGQNLVGYLRVKKVKGPRGHRLNLLHAEVLENGELGVRPLRNCKARDTYVLKGDESGESYEPRFTFHGFRFAQIEDWPSEDIDIFDAFEAVVCNTDMEETGSFSCSDPKVNKLFSNTKWSMRGNFLSLPTDCPQRDERLGWTGDLALFAPTATFLYGCFGVLRDWLRDVAYDQKQQNGVPPMVCPNVLQKDFFWGKVWPGAIWHDVTVLAPWALWEETGDTGILSQQYQSMVDWLGVIPRNETGCTHLWDFKAFQLADWLDPNAPPDEPFKAVTDPPLVANAFLINSLDLVAHVAALLGHTDDATKYQTEAENARNEFVEEYVSGNGRIISDSQTAYALAICFNLLSPLQKTRAGDRLADVVRHNSFKIGTGFAGTPFVCEALASTGHIDVAYKMLLNEKCPSWLYPISMGATTIWERWNSMMPDGSINPGEMTSFNHYAFGAVAKFLVERLAGLQRLSPGWKTSRVEPVLGGGFKSAEASHVTPYGTVSSRWSAAEDKDGMFKLSLTVTVPPTTTMEVVLPGPEGPKTEVVGSGEWSFSTLVKESDLGPEKEAKRGFPYDLMEEIEAKRDATE